MRALLPEPDADVDLHGRYAAGWSDGGGIRANMIASADGAAAAGGLSGGLQTAGDNRVFAVLRDLADVVVVGWSTARAEKYRPIALDEATVAVRRELGYGPSLPTAIVTRSLHVDLSAALFADPGYRPLVITCDSSDRGARQALAPRAEVLVCGDDEIDAGEMSRVLRERGLTRVLAEGGPTILARFAGGGVLDELCLSVSPLLVGPGPGRILAGDAWAAGPRPLSLVHALEEDGALFLRYAAAR